MTERSIVLVRHAKADRPSGVADIDRPLTARGHADAGAIGAWLAHQGHRPDLVICSPSKRTRQTWHGIALGIADASAAGDAPTPEVSYEAEVYDGGDDELLELLQSVDDAVGTVMVIGHNPSVSLLSTLLDPAEGGGADGLRTSGIAVHRFDGHWDALSPGGARIVETHTARG